MDAESLVTALVRLQLAASAAILLVLLLRPLALRWCGAGTAYWLWLVVPLAAMAVLLPAREQVVMNPTAPDIPFLQQHIDLQQHIEPDLDVGVTREHAATAPAVQPGVPDDHSRSGLLMALWLLGAGVFLIRSIVNTRRLASSSLIGPALVGVFRPRLVLPHDFEARFSAEEQTLILAHEEMHRVSRHTLVNALVEVARCASWFNPLAHLAAWRFRADQELACDTAVIAAHPQARRAYAEALLKAQVAGVYLPMGCVWTSGNAGRLAERIARLSEQLPGRRRRFVGAASIVGVGIAASYAAWAQQPARIITVQQPNTESAAVVATETPALEAPEAVRAPATRVPDVSRSSTSQAPQTPTVQAPQGPLPLGRFSIGEYFGPREVEREPGTTAINGESATREGDLQLQRLAAMTGEDLSVVRGAYEIGERRKEQLKDPEYRKLVLAQWRAAFVNRYPGVAQELGLSRKEAESLIDLLAANEVARMDQGLIPGGQTDIQETRRIARAFTRMQEESIQTQLGGKYAQWEAYKAYQTAILSTSRVDRMGRQLALAGVPLTQAQRNAVTTALVVESVRRNKELGIPLNSACVLSPADWMAPGCSSLPDLERQALPANLPDQAQMVEEEVRRTLQAIEPNPHTPHLNDDQLVVVREQVERLAADYLKFMQTERERLQTKLPQ